jgi:hypothetical protein
MVKKFVFDRVKLFLDNNASLLNRLRHWTAVYDVTFALMIPFSMVVLDVFAERPSHEFRQTLILH